MQIATKYLWFQMKLQQKGYKKHSKCVVQKVWLEIEAELGNKIIRKPEPLLENRTNSTHSFQEYH